jgi:hypothetical protein
VARVRIQRSETQHPKDTSSQGSAVQGTHRSRDALSKGRRTFETFRSGTHRSGTFYHIMIGPKFHYPRFSQLIYTQSLEVLLCIDLPSPSTLPPVRRWILFGPTIFSCYPVDTGLSPPFRGVHQGQRPNS